MPRPAPLPPHVFRAGVEGREYFVAYRAARGGPLRYGGHFRAAPDASRAAARLVGKEEPARICR